MSLPTLHERRRRLFRSRYSDGHCPGPVAPHRRRAGRLALVAGLVTAYTLVAQEAHAATGDMGFVAVTPYRPSVSSPAQLSAPGQLEAEAGVLHQRSTDQRRTSQPYLLKYAFDDRWGISLGGESHVWQHDASGRIDGTGDSVLTLKRQWDSGRGTAWGMELATKLPTARQPIGSGHADQSVNAIWSQDLGPVHVDTNVNTARLGQVDDDTSRWQLGASVAVSTVAVAKGVGLTWEISGTRRAGAPSGHQLLGAVTFSPSPLATFDIGVARAARPAPAVLSLFAGAVFPLARLH